MPIAKTPGDNPRLVAALAYVRRGWPVFPLQGKVPLKNSHGFQDATINPEQIQDTWKRKTYNIGLATGKVSGIFVLDVDPANGGSETLAEHETTYGTLPETPQVLTGNGGIHYYFRMPDMNLSISSGKLGIGLDTRGNGGYVVLPPSIHPDTKRPYAWEVLHDLEETQLADVPQWIIDLLLTSDKLPPVTEETRLRAGERHMTLFRHGCRLRQYGYSEAEILAFITQMNAQRCLPPVSEKDLQHLAKQSAKYQPGQSFKVYQDEKPVPLMNPDKPDPMLKPWQQFLLTKKNGHPTCNVSNVSLILANSLEWKEAFWWDAVRAQPMVKEQPLSDEIMIDIANWLGTVQYMAVSNIRLIEQCVRALCQKHPKDLLQTWLHALSPWDNVPRLDVWLSDVASAQKDEYGQAVSRILPLSMVARAMDPGCLYRYVVILEGPENSGKSSLVRELAGEGWYVELSIALENKESHMMLQGAWVAEMAELDSLTRTEETRLKAFITLKEDTWIPKYSNNRIAVPRRTIFVGTTNDESYLKGQAGNTRFLPIKTGAIEIHMFRAMRDQIFAEALHVYRHNPQTWWQLSDEAMSQATEERDARRVDNVYEESLQSFLTNKEWTTWPEIAEMFLQLKERAQWKDKSLQMQISQALKALGWQRARKYDDYGKRFRAWIKGPDEVGR